MDEWRDGTEEEEEGREVGHEWKLEKGKEEQGRNQEERGTWWSEVCGLN